MPLTFEQAKEAGRLASEIAAIDDAIAGLQGRLSQGALIVGMAADLDIGQTVRAPVRLNAQETTAILQNVAQVCLSRRAAMLAEMEALGQESEPAPEPQPEPAPEPEPDPVPAPEGEQ